MSQLVPQSSELFQSNVGRDFDLSIDPGAMFRDPGTYSAMKRLIDEVSREAPKRGYKVTQTGMATMGGLRTFYKWVGLDPEGKSTHTRGTMQILSTGQGIKSSNGGIIDNGNMSGNPQVSAAPGPGNYAESDGTNMYQFKSASGYEGPGKGNAKVLNSDDQMPCQSS